MIGTNQGAYIFPRNKDLICRILFSSKEPQSYYNRYFFYFNYIIGDEKRLQCLMKQGVQEKEEEIVVSDSGNRDLPNRK